MSELCPSGRSEGYEIRDDEAPRPRGSRQPRHGRHVLSNSFQSPTALCRGAFCGLGLVGEAGDWGPHRSPAKRVRWGEEERWNERALPARAKRGI